MCAYNRRGSRNRTCHGAHACGARREAGTDRRDSDGLDKAVAELRESGADAVSFVIDVGSDEDIDRLAAWLKENDIKIDILINNAGIWRDNTGNFWETDPKSWIRRWRINVYGLMYLTRAILPGMLERQYGRVINVASVAGIYGISGMTDYSAT